MSTNVVVLTGHITREIELKFTPSGKEVCNFGIAVNRFTKKEDGSYETDFFNVVAWGQKAKFISDYMHKGSKIAISGRLETRTWMDQTSGQNRTAFEIVAENVENLSPRTDNQDAQEGTPQPRTERPAPKTVNRPPVQPTLSEEVEEEDPFGDEE